MYYIKKTDVNGNQIKGLTKTIANSSTTLNLSESQNVTGQEKFSTTPVEMASSITPERRKYERKSPNNALHKISKDVQGKSILIERQKQIQHQRSQDKDLYNIKIETERQNLKNAVARGCQEEELFELKKKILEMELKLKQEELWPSQ